MDVVDYFRGIKFTTVGKDNLCDVPLGTSQNRLSVSRSRHKNKGFYILEARVDSGEEMIIRVLSSNKAVYLKDMRWKMIWGLFMKDQYNRKIQLPLQMFTPATEHCRNKVLVLHERDGDMTYYIHKQYPYAVDLPHDKNILDIYQREDKLTLIDAFGVPQFHVRKFG